MAEVLDLFGRVGKLVRDATDAELRPLGLRLGQDHLLAQLWHDDGRTPGQLAVAMGVSTPAVTKGATVLERAGLLERRRDASDNRLVRLWLTERGRDLREPVERARADVERTLLEGLSPAEVDQLASSLERVGRAALRVRGAQVDGAGGAVAGR